MKLSDDILGTIEEHIWEKGISQSCNECRAGNDKIFLDNYQIIFANNKDEERKPLLALHCKNCGALKFFDLETIIGMDEVEVLLKTDIE